MKISTVVLLLAAELLVAVLAEYRYFENGGELRSLQPGSVPTEGITAITWKHNGHLVAEWIQDGDDLTFYGDFNGRTDLNTITGQLTIRAMKKADEGDFTVEVNYKVQNVVYSAKMVTNLREKKVEVVTRPLTCNTNSIQCTLSCLGSDTDVGPVRFFWRRGEEQWNELQKDIIIINDDETKLIKKYSCKIQNPLSEKESDLFENPFKSEPQGNGGLVAGIVFLLLLILAGAVFSVFAYKHPERVAPCIPCVAGPRRQQTERSSHPDENSPHPDENSPQEPLTTEADVEMGDSNKATTKEANDTNMTPLIESDPGNSNGTSAAI